MGKIYSRPRIKLPRIRWNRGNIPCHRGMNNLNINTEKARKIVKIMLILIIAFSTVKLVLDAVLPIFDTLCEDKAKSIATIVSNEQATNVMREHSYDELFSIERDDNGNITMIRANVIPINEIISDIPNKIQEEINNRGREDIEIALRKFYRIQTISG